MSYPYETNPVSGDDQNIHLQPGVRMVRWTEPGLRITRLRLLSDPGFPLWDVSYCWGFIGQEPVMVSLPFTQLPKRSVCAAILKEAIADGVNAKRLGLFNPDCISRLW